MKVTMDKIKEFLMEWFVKYPEAGYGFEQIETLAGLYHNDLIEENISEKQFCWAAKQAGRRCQFFPKMIDIIRFVEEYRRNPPDSDQLMIGHQEVYDLTPQQLENNKKHIEVCKLAVNKKITMEQAKKMHADISRSEMPV